MRMLLVIVFAVAGCDNTEPVSKDWEAAPKEYRCTDQQMERVHHQSSWCDKNTSYLRNYCYGTAFIRNCTKTTGEQQ